MNIDKAKKFWDKCKTHSEWKYFTIIDPVINSFIEVIGPNKIGICEEIIPNGEEIRDMKFEVAKKFDKTVNIAILEERKRILNEMQDIEDGSYCDVQTPNWRLLKNRINK